MAESGKTVRCVVVTPEKAVLDEAATFVTVPMYDGELGVQAGRAPLIGRLGPGELRLTTAAGTRRYFVEAGFVQVRADVVTVLTARAVPAAEVTLALADVAAAEAGGLPAGNPVERENRTKARERAQGMRRVAAKNAAG